MNNANLKDTGQEGGEIWDLQKEIAYYQSNKQADH